MPLKASDVTAASADAAVPAARCYAAAPRRLSDADAGDTSFDCHDGVYL